ncbi:hypothetical protein ABZ499_00970 [Streptomyces sp. NPDC019990]|uniref:hypothetical protein n=1 Tax=Streptomyces sp. NPDC019990 TaxID=3154693 RepID=UPI0033F738CA
MLGMLGGGALAAHAYSNSQQDVPNPDYGAVLWRNAAADELFPATLGSSTTPAADKKTAQWSRMGISQDTSCAKGLSGKTKETAQKLGCEAVLRATYVDLTGEMVATVAIIVLPKGGTGAKEMGEYLYGQESEDAPDAAVVPYAVPDTLAAKWQENRRNGMGGARFMGGPTFPYAVAATTGAVDGRTQGNLPGDFGGYGADDDDKLPWMDAAHALSQTFSNHLINLDR